MQNKLNTNAFMREQLEIGKEAFVKMFRASLETEEAEAEEAEA